MHQPRRTSRPSPVAAAALALALVATACGGAATPSPTSPSAPPPTAEPTAPPSATPAPTATAAPTAAPTATPPEPTEVPTATAVPPEFVCGETVRRPGTAPRAQIVGLEVANEGGTGQITFTFARQGNLAAVPEVVIRPARPPFTRDPSGLPLDVPGAAFVSIVLLGGTALDENYEPTYEGPFDFDPAGTPLVAFRRAGDFEAVSSYVAGLDGAPCVRILPLDGTGRLVIELTAE